MFCCMGLDWVIGMVAFATSLSMKRVEYVILLFLQDGELCSEHVVLSIS